MLRCLQSPENFIGNGVTVLERLRERLLWLQQLHQQQPQQNHGIQNNSLELYQKPLFDRLDNNDFGSFMLDRTDKMGFSSSEIATNSSLEEMDNSFSRRPCSFPPVAAAATKTFDMEKAKVTPTMGRDSLKKRKAEIGVTDDYCKEKRIKEDVDETESSKVTEKTNKGSSTTTTTTTSKDNSKASDVQKQDYIHVRARRGQATDNHSIAERARREKIGKKMKCLQDLVPGCNKITGKAGMLDEIINYVQSLQGQVEFLSMKLASLNPRLDFNNGNFFAKEFPAYAANFPAAALCSPEMANLASLQFNAMQQGAQNCVLDMQMNPKQLPAHKTTTATSSSVSVPEMYLEQTSSITQVQPFSAWDTDLQNLYNVEFH